MPLFEVIHKDADLLIISKPAGLVCHPTKTDELSSLISRARLYLGPASQPRLVNRLDRETSGVTVIAKNPQTAGTLGRIWETRQVEKEYIAIVHGHVAAEDGIIDAPLGKDETSRVAIKDCVRADGTSARTQFHVLSRLHAEHIPVSLLRIIPQTGRKHQIRIHLAHIGHPIVGDKLYGGDEDLYMALVENRLTAEQRARLILPYHALHAGQVRFPWNSQIMEFKAQPERWFLDYLGSGQNDKRR